MKIKKSIKLLSNNKIKLPIGMRFVRTINSNKKGPPSTFVPKGTDVEYIVDKRINDEIRITLFYTSKAGTKYITELIFDSEQEARNYGWNI